MICPAGLPRTLRQAFWEDLKQNWKGWLKFIFWEIPRDLITGE